MAPIPVVKINFLMLTKYLPTLVCSCIYVLNKRLFIFKDADPLKDKPVSLGLYT